MTIIDKIADARSKAYQGLHAEADRLLFEATNELYALASTLLASTMLGAASESEIINLIDQELTDVHTCEACSEPFVIRPFCADSFYCSTKCRTEAFDV
jgi:hypothetical protein